MMFDRDSQIEIVDGISLDKAIKTLPVHKLFFIRTDERGEKFNKFVIKNADGTITIIPDNGTLESLIEQVNGIVGDRYFIMPFVNVTTVVVNHNFGKKPATNALDETLMEFGATVQHLDDNTCVVSWNNAMSGFIVCN